MRREESSGLRAQGLRFKVFVLSGPSGSGKTTLVKKLLQDTELKRRVSKSISFTTRPRRSGERNKKDYLFITQEEFSRKLKEKKVIEYTRYLGYYYATPKDYLQQRLKRKNVILCLDLKGAFKLKRLYPKNTVTIFIVPPSLKVLEERIGRRCNKTGQEEIRQRMKLAGQELAAVHRFDYCLVNSKLSQAQEELKTIILGEIKH